MFDETLKKGFYLESATRLHKKHPNTFEIPKKSEREGLEVGQVVKLMFVPKDKLNGLPERMWVCITSVEAKHYEGLLHNTPVAGLRNILVHGDAVKFQACNILQIQDPA